MAGTIDKNGITPDAIRRRFTNSSSGESDRVPIGPPTRIGGDVRTVKEVPPREIVDGSPKGSPDSDPPDRRPVGLPGQERRTLPRKPPVVQEPPSEENPDSTSPPRRGVAPRAEEPVDDSYPIGRDRIVDLDDGHDDDWFDEKSYNGHHHDDHHYDHHHHHWDYDHHFSIGFHFGFEFGWCWDLGGHLFWYYYYPGYSSCYFPYRSYYRPSCYYLPAYYPSYSEVRYVHEYVDDSSYYPVLPSSTPIDPDLEFRELIELGWDLFRAADYAGAAESFRRATVQRPDDALVKLAFAQALFAIGNYPDAAFVLRRALELDPDWPLSPPAILERYGDPADHAEQMLAVRTFLDYMPDDPSSTLVLATQDFLIGDVEKGRDLLEKLKEMDPEDHAVQRLLEATIHRR